jgi:hypothetical protein
VFYRVVVYYLVVIRMDKSLVLLAGGIWLCADVQGALTDAGDNPYQKIVVRNVFGLRDPVPPPAPTVPTPPATPSNIKITGISNTSKVKKAHFMVSGKTPDKTEYCSLSEGEGKDALEVLEIDFKAGSVKVRISGVEKVMTFDADGLKNPTGPVPAPGAPGVPGMPQGMPGMPNVAAPNLPPGVVQPGVPGAIPRVMAPGSPATASASAPGTTAALDINSQFRYPSRAVRVQAEQQAQAQHDQSVIMMELHREVNRDQITRGSFPPLPPTVLSMPDPSGGPPGLPGQ